jgi:hypothetical protein
MAKSDHDPNILRQNEALAKRKVARGADAAKQAAITEKIKNDYFATPGEMLVPAGGGGSGQGDGHGQEHGPEHADTHRRMRAVKTYRAR